MVEVEAFFRTILLKVWTCSAKQIFPFFFLHFTGPTNESYGNQQTASNIKKTNNYTFCIGQSANEKKKYSVADIRRWRKGKKNNKQLQKNRTHTYHHRFRAEQNKKHAESAIFIIVIDVTPFSF